MAISLSFAGSGDPSATPNSVILPHRSPDSGCFALITTTPFCTQTTVHLRGDNSGYKKAPQISVCSTKQPPSHDNKFIIIRVVVNICFVDCSNGCNNEPWKANIIYNKNIMVVSNFFFKINFLYNVNLTH